MASNLLREAKSVHKSGSKLLFICLFPFLTLRALCSYDTRLLGQHTVQALPDLYAWNRESLVILHVMEAMLVFRPSGREQVLKLLGERTNAYSVSLLNKRTRSLAGVGTSIWSLQGRPIGFI